MSCYTPHAGKEFQERVEYFQHLAIYWKSISSHGPKLCFGDFNSRLYCRFAGEEEIIGEYFFQNDKDHLHPSLNRFLLLEFCAQFQLQIANTFLEKPKNQLVTYRELATQSLDIIISRTFI